MTRKGADLGALALVHWHLRPTWTFLLGWLVGAWLVGWLEGGLVGWWVGWLVGRARRDGTGGGGGGGGGYPRDCGDLSGAAERGPIADSDQYQAQNRKSAATHNGHTINRK